MEQQEQLPYTYLKKNLLRNVLTIAPWQMRKLTLLPLLLVSPCILPSPIPTSFSLNPCSLKKRIQVSQLLYYTAHTLTPFLLLIARSAYCLCRILEMSTKALAFLVHDSESITRREEFQFGQVLDTLLQLLFAQIGTGRLLYHEKKTVCRIHFAISMMQTRPKQLINSPLILSQWTVIESTYGSSKRC